MGASVTSAAPPQRAYVDPSQLDCPWPKHSDYKQPWRGYLETKPAVDFLAGIGVNWASPGNDELAVRLLAEAGFKAFRIEIGWGSVKWDESGIHNHDRDAPAAEAVQAIRHPADDAAERAPGRAVPGEVLRAPTGGRCAPGQPLGEAHRRPGPGRRADPASASSAITGRPRRCSPRSTRRRASAS